MNYKEIAWNCLKNRLKEMNENNLKTKIEVSKILNYMDACDAPFAVNILDEIKKLEE